MCGASPERSAEVAPQRNRPLHSLGGGDSPHPRAMHRRHATNREPESLLGRRPRAHFRDDSRVGRPRRSSHHVRCCSYKVRQTTRGHDRCRLGCGGLRREGPRTLAQRSSHPCWAPASALYRALSGFHRPPPVPQHG